MEPFADESQHHSVSDPLADQLEQALPTDAVKETHDTLPTSETFPLKFA
jgi:hypothetical protein